MSHLGSAIEIVEINAGHRKQGGSYVEWVYEGTQDAVNAAFNQFLKFIRVDDLFRTKTGSNLYRLTVRRDDVFTQAQFPLIHQVKMQTHRVLKSIFEPPLPLNLSTATAVEIARIKEELRKPETPGQSPAWVVTQSAGGQALYFLALRGVQYRVIEQPHLIKTTSAINSYVWSISFSNIGSIFSTEAVVVDAGIVTPLRFALPNFDDPADTLEGLSFTYGWLKHGPAVDPGPENTEIVTQTYEYGLWSADMYPAAA